MQGYISPAQTCALIILGCGGEHVRERKMWTEDTITQAKQLILKMGITFGSCEHCGDFAWLYKVSCSCGPKNGHTLRGRTCEKRLCGRCYQLYPPKNLRKLVRYAAKENIPLTEIVR